jgi:predicted component of type VI protein secretion system
MENGQWLGQVVDYGVSKLTGSLNRSEEGALASLERAILAYQPGPRYNTYVLTPSHEIISRR